MSEQPTKEILLVEDDLELSALVREFLESRGGYSVTPVHRGDEAASMILSDNPDLVILDIMLPQLDGLEVCRRIRKKGYVGPVLMLTALGDEVDEIVGLEVGADDYMAKPVTPRLLLARVQAMLRRDRRTASVDSGQASGGPLDLGDLLVEPASRTVILADDELRLTTSEFDLLLYLGERAGQVVSREDLYYVLRGIEWDGLDRSVDQRIRRLREKLGDDANNPKRIKSVRGAGYLLVVHR